MEFRKPKRLGGCLSALWRGVDVGTRIIFSVVVLTVTFAFLAALGGDTPTVPDEAALVIAPKGLIVEQLAGDPIQRAIDKVTGDEQPETLWRDLDEAIRAAKDDKRIKALLLDLDQMAGAGLSKLQLLRAAIEDFKESGKPVVAAGDFYGKSQYYLAAAADEIHLHHMGMVFLDGYGRFRTYYKEGLDRIEVDWNVFKVGEYKSAVEPFLRRDMSDEAKTANLEWMGDLWRSYVDDVAAARGLTAEALDESIERMKEQLQAAAGQASDVALNNGLVDHVGSRDQLRDRMIELVGEDEESHSFHRIGHQAYLQALGDKRHRYSSKGDSTIAVVVAKGTILNGTQPAGTIGGDSTGALLREARQDEDVKAIVLRVDSGGGSAFASEVIRREMVLARDAGKKVVVSMGTLAASGGYWISSASDEIWASPTTITGSIGIFGMLPTFQKPMAKYLGWNVDGVGTTWLSGAGRIDRELDANVGEMIQSMIDRGYQEFITRVAEARNMSLEEVDEIGRGRVWSGMDAKELGLVDQLGGLDDAIASAAALAELGDDYAVRFVEKELDFGDQLMLELLTRAGVWFSGDDGSRLPRRPLMRDSLLDFVGRQAETLAVLDDPAGMYALCMCEVD
ncbi:MAG: signal peptide peptidase SppA [Thermoanaerobaculia bacterium]